jgi:hypothetical protein
MSDTAGVLSRRDVALLTAVAQDRCEIVHGSLPVLFVDGRLSCDASAARRLIAAGLLQRPGLGTGRWPARLTEAGQAELAGRAQPAGGPGPRG